MSKEIREKIINIFGKLLNEENEINNKNMKELMMQALSDAFVVLEKRVPQTKSEFSEIDISDIKPFDIVDFMKENDIPDNARFGILDNGEYGFSSSITPVLCYRIDTPTTEKDKLKFKRKQFPNIAHKHIYELLIKNGYKRKGFNSGLLKQFDDTTVYDMYINKEFDRLLNYYSLSFVKE